MRGASRFTNTPSRSFKHAQRFKLRQISDRLIGTAVAQFSGDAFSRAELSDQPPNGGPGTLFRSIGSQPCTSALSRWISGSATPGQNVLLAPNLWHIRFSPKAIHRKYVGVRLGVAIIPRFTRPSRYSGFRTDRPATATVKPLGQANSQPVDSTSFSAIRRTRS